MFQITSDSEVTRESFFNAQSADVSVTRLLAEMGVRFEASAMIAADKKVE